MSCLFLIHTDEGVGMTHPAVDGGWNPQQTVALLIECGEIALCYWGKERGELKGDHSLVTRADREIEDLLVSRLDAPEKHQYVIGEETVEKKGEDYVRGALEATTYVVDPIDGTAPYAHGLWHWGISVGRMEAARLTDGAIYLPASGEILVTDGDAVRCLKIEDGVAISDVIVKPDPRTLQDGGMIAVGQDIARYGRVHTKNSVQALSTAVVPFAYMAQGGFAAYVSPLKLWDLAGGLPMMFRHGFSVSTLEGGPFDLNVTEAQYFLDPDHPKRWSTRGTLVICHAGEEQDVQDSVESPAR